MRHNTSEKQLSIAIIMMKYNPDFWPLYIFFFRPSVPKLFQSATRVLQSPTGRIKSKDHQKALLKVSVPLWLTREVIIFFSFNQLPAFRLAYLNVIYWNALIASIISLCLPYFSSFIGRKYLKNVGIARLFSMYTKVNELVLNETKEETMLKTAQKFLKKS